MMRAVFVLAFFSSHVIAHPGHAAPDFHWHPLEIALAIIAVVFLVVKALKK